ncbi:hypothetical protein DSO57_1008135 [Entomophthora muscae]|uniref:Uncharacterized protein n=1 Tax=Entomophthora muscae TaxID=34485 RepID=A0ACC2SK73_9FUNG|nr:hypothetical protein DSO57_1008135 [Entomophthora muscae]
MSYLLLFGRAKFGVLCVEAAAARKEVPTSLLEEAWASLEGSKIAPEESLVEVKAAFEELYSDYFARKGTLAQGNQVYAWDSWNLLLGFNEILQQVKDRANCEVEALRNREEKSVKIMACWRDDTKALSHRIPSLEAKLLEALSQEGTSNKSQGQDNKVPFPILPGVTQATYDLSSILPLVFDSAGCHLNLPGMKTTLALEAYRTHLKSNIGLIPSMIPSFLSSSIFQKVHLQAPRSSQQGAPHTASFPGHLRHHQDEVYSPVDPAAA